MAIEQLENGLWLRPLHEPCDRFVQDVARIDYAVAHAQGNAFNFVEHLEGEEGLYKTMEWAAKKGHFIGMLALAGSDEHSSPRVGYAWGVSMGDAAQGSWKLALISKANPRYDSQELWAAMTTRCILELAAKVSTPRPSNFVRTTGKLLRGLGILPVDSTWPSPRTN